jgi:hypothetical protein
MPQALPVLLLLLVQSLFANTFFLSVVYHPDESQLVTAGTDRKVSRHALCRSLQKCILRLAKSAI